MNYRLTSDPTLPRTSKRNESLSEEELRKFRGEYDELGVEDVARLARVGEEVGHAGRDERPTPPRPVGEAEQQRPDWFNAANASDGPCDPLTGVRLSSAGEGFDDAVCAVA